MANPAGQSRMHAAALAQWLLLAALVLLAAAGGCRDKPDTPPQDAPPSTDTQPPAERRAASPVQPDPPTQSAVLALIGDFRGFTQPCGCTPYQPGGFVRLGTILDTARSIAAGDAAGGSAAADVPAVQRGQLQAALAPSTQRIWPVDCGNFAWVGGRFQDERLRTHLEALAVLGARAVVPGAGELQMREADARSLADSPLPLVSANLTLKQPLFELRRHIELAPGWYLTGVSSWQPLLGTPPQESWWTMGNPVEAVKSVLAELPADARLIVIATYQPESVYAELRQLPLAALIGPGSWRIETTNEEIGASDMPQLPAGSREKLRWPVELPAPPTKAVFLPLLRLEAGSGAAQPGGAVRYLEVTQEWPDSPAVLAVLDEQTRRLQERARQERAELAAAYGDSGFDMAGQFLPEDQQVPDPKLLRVKLGLPASYTGSAACASCHAEADKIWQASVHSHALRTLEEHAEQQNMDCLQCHVVGLYERGGFNPDEPLTQLSAVGCENCHGPGSQHIAAAKLAELEGGQWPVPAEQWQGAKYSIERSSLPNCIKCHDSYNSPKFEPQSYWEKIAH